MDQICSVNCRLGKLWSNLDRKDLRMKEKILRFSCSLLMSVRIAAIPQDLWIWHNPERIWEYKKIQLKSQNVAFHCH